MIREKGFMTVHSGNNTDRLADKGRPKSAVRGSSAARGADERIYPGLRLPVLRQAIDAISDRRPCWMSLLALAAL